MGQPEEKRDNIVPNTTYLTPEELSGRYKNEISVKTLANWRSHGGGPKYSKIGGKILYPLNEVQAWEASRTVESTSQYGSSGK